MAKNRTVRLAMTVVVVALIAVVVFVIKPSWLSGAKHSDVPMAQPVDISITDQPTMGDSHAPLEIVAFEDLKCFNCKLFDTQLLPWIIKTYVDTGVARYTMINVAFLPDSMQAAVAARCVYQLVPKAFFSYVDILYEHQGAEDENWANTAKLLQWSHAIDGLDTEAFSSCLLSSKNTTDIINNTQYGMKVMGGELATPSVYINGVSVRPLTKEQFKLTVDQLKP